MSLTAEAREWATVGDTIYVGDEPYALCGVRWRGEGHAPIWKLAYIGPTKSLQKDPLIERAADDPALALEAQEGCPSAKD